MFRAVGLKHREQIARAVTRLRRGVVLLDRKAERGELRLQRAADLLLVPGLAVDPDELQKFVDQSLTINHRFPPVSHIG